MLSGLSRGQTGQAPRLELSSEANESGGSPGVGSARRPCFLPSKRAGGQQVPRPRSTKVGAGIGETQPPYRGLLLDLCVLPKAKTTYGEPFFWNYGPSISSPVLANLPPKSHVGSQGRAGGWWWWL